MISILDELFVVIVLYKCKISDSLTINSLNRSLAGKDVNLPLLLYDNSPESLTIDEKCDSLKNFEITYIHDKDNGGLGKAYNTGYGIALKNNKRWLLLLDQDTNLNKDIFLGYDKAVNLFKDISLFVPIMMLENGQILSPCSFRHYYGSHLKKVFYGKQEFGTKSLINSGILVTMESFQQVGGYNEKVKLDFSDHQFIENYKQNHKHFVVIESTCVQNFSALEDNAGKQIIRFKYYCQGIYYFKARYAFAKVLMTTYLFLKVIKKSLKYKSIVFFKIFYREAVKRIFS